MGSNPGYLLKSFLLYRNIFIEEENSKRAYTNKIFKMDPIKRPYMDTIQLDNNLSFANYHKIFEKNTWKAWASN